MCLFMYLYMCVCHGQGMIFIWHMDYGMVIGSILSIPWMDWWQSTDIANLPRVQNSDHGHMVTCSYIYIVLHMYIYNIYIYIYILWYVCYVHIPCQIHFLQFQLSWPQPPIPQSLREQQTRPKRGAGPEEETSLEIARPVKPLSLRNTSDLDYKPST